MVGVPSRCPPHPFSQFPTSRHPCRPAWTHFFANLAIHGLCTTLHTLPCTSMHLHVPLHTSAHLHALSWYDLPSPSPPTPGHLQPHPPPLHTLCLHSTPTPKHTCATCTTTLHPLSD